MDPGSSQDSETDRASQDGFFVKPKAKKRGRKPANSSPASPASPAQEAKKYAFENPTTSQAATQNETTITKPASITTVSNTKNLQHKLPSLSHTFIVYSAPTTTRVQLAIRWEEINKDNHDIIIKQENNFLIKTNNEEKATTSLQLLVQQKIVTSFKLSNINSSTIQPIKTNRHITPSYSVVATGVDLDITDEMFSEHLQKLNLQIRFCKRIISRQRGTPTLMMRLITGDLSSYEKLMNDRMVHFLGRVFRIIESKPPAPVPAPCNKCSLFDHKTEECKQPVKCNKCQGPHTTTKCTSPLPTKCAACNSEDHAAWSRKCPKRPTAPIDGIPNVKIRCHNKRSAEVSDTLTAESRIHTPMTTHDYIINKYKHQLNKTNNINREELLKKMRRQFMDDFDVDTSVVFFGNHIYILMFDMLLPHRNSPTEPDEQLKQTTTNIGHSF